MLWRNLLGKGLCKPASLIFPLEGIFPRKFTFSGRRHREMKHLFDFSDFNVYDSEITNLSVGAPGPDLLAQCCEIFKEATEHRLNYEKENNSFLFQYGPTLGMNDFREELSTFLTREYGSEVQKKSIVLTSGATNGLHHILSCLLDMNAVIFVDEVTYMIALEAFQQFTGMKIIPVPFRDDGVDIGELRRLVQLHKFTPHPDKLFWGLYYAIPTFHNPTGVTLSREKCQNLVAMAREFDFLISCDDVYNLLYYTGESPKRLFAYDRQSDEGYRGHIISNGSFSKILSPGIRIGWMECPKRIVEVFRNSGIIKSGGAINNYTSGIVTSLLQLGLAKKQLTTYCAAYKERMEAVCKILRDDLPPEVKFIPPTGGYFAWLTFPPTFDAVAFNQFCQEHHSVIAIAGPKFSPIQAHRNCLRICVVFHSVDTMRNATRRLCAAYRAFVSR
uniref:Aminotransferase class I/classII large domain-containing protein n=2 Tax=Lutzomyia longipalpis TaxID=7200 RepID=A0A1B0CAU3_LUTLO